MSGQLTLSFAPPASAPAAADTTAAPIARDAHDCAPAAGGPTSRADSPRTEPEPGLPELRLAAGYEMYRDGFRTVIRKPGEARWGATVRTGPTTHRFVGAGPDPAVLWSLAGRAAARAAVDRAAAPGSA